MYCFRAEHNKWTWTNNILLNRRSVSGTNRWCRRYFSAVTALLWPRRKLNVHFKNKQINNIENVLKMITFGIDYQISHFSTGFIFDPIGQLKSSANAGILLTVPITRNFSAVCSLVRFSNSCISGRLAVHQKFALDIQNICFGVYFSPGKPFSTPYSCTHFKYAR